jgi:hypothetical protein
MFPEQSRFARRCGDRARAGTKLDRTLEKGVPVAEALSLIKAYVGDEEANFTSHHDGRNRPGGLHMSRESRVLTSL